MIKINNLTDIKLNRKHLPNEVVEDVYSRMLDWLESGGSLKDQYITKQFEYLEKVANLGIE